MTGSIFSTLSSYFKTVFQGFRSVLGSSFTVFPYLFGIGEHRKEVTEQYPDPVSSRTEDDLPTKFRGILYNDIDRCTGCRECQVVCPADCIQIETEPGPDLTKTWVSVFDIDFGQCMFCGLCVESCQPQSLYHTRQFEGAVYDLNDLVRSFGKGRVTPEQRQRWETMRLNEELD